MIPRFPNGALRRLEGVLSRENDRFEENPGPPPLLLAKWRNDRGADPKEWKFVRGHTLDEHLDECIHMGKALLDRTQFGRKLYQVMQLRERFGIPRKTFRRLCLLAILLHDLGKAGFEFSRMLWLLEESYLRLIDQPREEILKTHRESRKDFPQAHRHEWLGAALLCLSPYWEWLVREAGGEQEALWVLAAVRGHHLKHDKGLPNNVQENNPDLGQVPKRDLRKEVRVYTLQMAHAVNKVIRQQHLPFSEFPCLGPQMQNEDGDPTTLRTSPETLLEKSEHLLGGKTPETPFTAAIKFVVVLADSFGSMTPAQGFRGTQEGFRRFLVRQINRALKPVFWTLHGRTDQRHLENPNPIQKEADSLPEGVSALIDASTGGGKTLADLRALTAPGDPEMTSRRRAVFTLTTTATAAQIYDDVGTEADTLRSSRARLDEKLWVLRNPDGDGLAQHESEEMIRDLAGFISPVTFATIDQVLGVVAFSRRSIMWLLYLVNAAVVFDEYHDYDPQLRRWFHTFLDWFPGIRMIASSGSATAAQQKKLQELRPKIEIIKAPVDKYATTKRFRFHMIQPQEAFEVFQASQKTLWFVNRVRDAQEVAEACEDALIYHARDRYGSRVETHKRFVAAFREQQAVRAVTTQVSQLSLDITARRGISEKCPVWDKMQRLGRLTARGDAAIFMTDIFLYQTDKTLPYRNLEQHYPWYDELPGKDWSYRDLQAHYLEYTARFDEGKEAREEDHQPLLMETFRHALRESHPMVSAILETDLEQAKAEAREQGHYRLQWYEFATFLNSVQVTRGGRHTDLYPRYRYRYIVPFERDPRLGILIPSKSQDAPFWEES